MARVIDQPNTQVEEAASTRPAAPVFAPLAAPGASDASVRAPRAAPRASAAPVRSPRAARGEAAARRELRRQVAKLELELAQALAATSPDDRIAWSIAADADVRGPRLLGLGELEQLRDDLAERLHEVREVHARRAAREALKRGELALLLDDPARNRFVRITRRDVGEPGCGAWESRPRLGLIGMLAGWWHVKVSSGCPLATAPTR